LFRDIAEERNACTILVGTPERKRLLGRARSGWEDSIKMVLRDIKWGGMDRINLVQNVDH
jgi:hypothetical protein